MLSTLQKNFDSVDEGLKLCRRSFISVGIFSGVANILMLVPAFFMLNVYDKAVGHNSLSTLVVLSLFTAVMFVGLALMEAVRSRVLVAVSARIDQLLSPGLYQRTFTNAVNVGPNQATTRPLQDLLGLRQFITGNGIFALFDAPWVPIYLIVMFMFHPLLGWMGVIATVVFFCIALANQRSSAPALGKANQLAASSNADTQRNLRNAEVAASMGMMGELQRRWRTQQDTLLAHQAEASNTAGTFNAITKTLRMAVQSGAIAAGAYLVLIQEISPGMIIAGSILIGRALQPVELAVGAWKGFVDAREQYSRLNEMMANIPVAEERMSLPPIKGHVRANGAVVVPPGSRTPSVRQASFDIPAGTTTMFIGASGAGKSSLIRGILGLWKTAAGDIRIDGAESASYSREELGPQIGYLPQDIELLEGTVSANIARFGEIDADAVVQAAQDAGVHEFILGLANGYDTEIGKPGGMLSPGQRQRVALARALYRRPALVVLDEPNSNLDERGEVALNEAIKILKQNGSTVLVVSHRQGVLPLADSIVLMANGVVTDFGPTQEVLARLQAQQSQQSPQPVKPAPAAKPALAAANPAPAAAARPAAAVAPFNTVSWSSDGEDG